MLFSTDLRLTCAPTTGCFYAYAFRKKVDAHATPCQLSQHTREVTIGCPSNGRRASSISSLPAPAAQTGAGRDCLLPPPRGRLCCRAGLTAPPYSHRWSSHPSTHPHLLLFSGDGRRTSKPSYSRTPLCVRNKNNGRVFPTSVSFPS